MNLKVFCVSFINLLVALAVTTANADKLTAKRNYLSDECQKEASAFYDKRKISFNDFKSNIKTIININIFLFKI